MEKKLLSVFFTFSLFFLNPFSGFGQACPTSVSISSDTGTTICAGTDVTFNANFTGGTGTLSYQWKSNGSDVQTGGTSYGPVKPTNGQKIEVVVTSSDNAACSTTGSITMTVNPQRTGSVTIQASNTNICPGDNINFSISNISNAGSGATYVWKVNGSQTGTNSTNFSSTLSNNDKVTLTVQSSVPCTPEFTSNEITIIEKPGKPNTPGAISGNTEVCPGDIVTYSISSVTNASTYTWSVPSGWTINTGQNSTNITVTAGNAGQNGNISVTASNDCGTSSNNTLGVTVKPGTPASPGTITGTKDVCPGDSVTYSIDSVTNADANGYIWSVPSGWTINSGQNSTSITVTAGNAGQNGNISVNASNSCGTSSDKTLGVTVKPGTPSTPGTITGTPDVCPGGSVTYSISSVTNADANGYTWSVPSGWTINSGQNSTSITVTAGNAGQNGNISANASNSCGTSSNKTLGVTVKPGTPATPGTITGTVAVCASATGLTYSVAAVTDATSYNWSLPLAWVVQSGAGTRNITVNAASASGNITVTAQNNCGTSSAQTLAVTTTNGVPAQPGTITSSLGSNPNICPPLSGVTFNVTAVGGATSYLWTLPTGFQVTSGANSNSITVKVNSSQTYNSPVSVSVQAVNLCGPGISRTYSGIEIGNYILTDIGPDQTVCKTLSPVTINGTVTFGSAKFKPAYTTSGGGSFPGPPSNNVSGNFSFTYQPIQADLNAGQVTITFTVPKPNGNNSSCGNGIDDMVIYFRDAPTANISAGPTICAGSATDLTITGTANTTVTYKEGSGANQKVDLGSGGSAPINTGNLNSTTTFQLVSSVYNSAPTCQASLNKTSTVTVTPVPTATISYSGTPFCTSDAPPKSVTLSGTGAYQNGVYSVTPTGLTIDSASGNINPSTSNPGTYTVKYTVPASGGCSTVEVTTQVTITKLPTSSINYSGTPFCQSLTTAQPVTLSGTDGYSGGSFSSNSGLTINSSTGAITPSTSTPGTYTITYTTPAANGCGTTTSTSDIVITETPTPQIEYSPSEFCTSETSAQNVILTGGGNISDGTFTAPVGLSIISLTGTITPSTSTPGIYSVTYTLSPDGGCGEITTTTEVIITQDPSVDISYNGPYCTSDPVLKDVIYSNPVGAYENGTFISSPSGLNITADGKINPSSSTAGTYTVTYTIPDSGGCSSKDVTTTVEISEAPEATIGYIDSPFCNSDINAKTVSYTETAGAYEGGAFSSTSGLTIDENTGDITPSTSTPGTYTVSYTIPAGDGCGEITATTDIQIYNAPQITTQPFNVAVCTANSAQLEVQASGDNLSYQWYKGTGPGTKINGATSAVLSINQATTADGGVYYVIVSGESSCTTDKSDEVTLNVDENIVITTQPQSQDICEDGTLNLSIAATATGGNPQYQWRKDGSPLSDDGRISGATTANLNISNLTSLDDGDYDVIIDGPDGYTCDTGYSNPAVITITPTVTINAFAPTTSTRCQGAGIVTTTTTATNSTVITYSLDAASITGGNTIDAASGAVTYAAGWSGTTTITASAAGCNGPATTTHEVTITPTVTINAFAPTTSTRCQGAGTMTTTTTATNFTGITYSLDATSLTGGNTIVAASGAVTYAAGWSGTTTITASAAGCNGPATTTHVVTVTPTVTINAFSPATSTRCQGAGTLTTTTTANNSTGITYSLDAASLTGGNTIVAATGAVTYAATWSGTTTITASAAGCNGPATTTHVVTIDPVPVGGKLLFNGTDRIFLICEEPADGYAVPLTLSGKIGAVVKWQFRTSTATSWSDLIVDSQIFTGTSLAAADIETLNISEATVFRAEINSGACLPNVFSETAIISVIPSNMEPSPVTVDKPVICIGDEVQLSSETGYGISFGKFEGGAFDNSSITNFGWRITDENGNTDYNFSSNADNRRPDKWLRTNPHDFATANITTNAITNQRWDTSLDSEGNKGFAIVSGDHPSTLETAVFSLSGLDEAILTFDQAFNLTSGASIQVEISTNGGASYTSEPILYYQAGPASSDNYNHFGNGTPDVNQMEIDLGDYIGFGNLRIRFKYDGTKDGDIWALDNIKVPEGPRGVTLNWTDYTDPENPIYIGSSNTETWTPSKIGWNTFVVKTELILDSAGNTCSSVVNSKEVKVFAFDQYTSTASSTGGTCGAIEVQLHGEIAGATSQELMTLPTPDGYTASWTVVGPSGYNSSASATHFFPSVNDPNAIFTPGFSGNYTLTWTMTPNAKDEAGNLIINPGCPPVYNPVTFDIEDCTTLDFDGEDDYVDLGTGYTGTYSIELWIRPESSTGTIISGPTFEIKMADLPSSVAPNTRWYHIAVSGGKLYIDGIESGSAGSGNGGSSTLIGARSTSGEPENYFSGWIEEVRIWKKAITPDQIQFMMNQHLENAGNMGVEIPMPVPGGLVYGDLAGYYRLISKVPDPLNLVTFPAALYPLNGFTPDLALNAVQGRLYNMTTNQENTAPMPYISGDNGDWETGGNTTWLRPSVWDDPNSKGIDGTTPIEWNIVRTKHNIKSKAKDITVLGLISETGELNMMDPGSPANEYNKGQFLRVTHYLKLDGVIDLEGESQLLQDSGSILDEASAGYLERDQQGKRNSFVYNYWSSPVSPQGGKTNNAPYSVKSVLMDGTIPATPTTINFRPGYWEADWARTTPNITISAYWLWGYKPATADIYAEWDWIHEDGPLNTGEGFTMKGTDGTASISAEQNYTFRGKPHNGDFDLSMGAGQNYLIGNPYPSAMDADEFIRNNITNGGNNDDSVNVFDGALYFWDHFEKLNHILIEYVGGYATYNFIGGVPAISDDYRINANDAQGSKYPGPYIPVAQAFLINSSDVNAAGVIISGGDVHFKNSQRSFQREQVDDSQFLKPEVNTKTNKEKTQEKSKIRISFKSPVGYYRQILVGAIPSATNGFDLGYDALLFDDNVEDMYWMQGDNNLVIQGVSNFDKDQILPLGIKIKENKEFKIKIDTLENAPSEMNVYLNDKLKDSIHDLKAGAYVSTSEPGYIHDRFEIIFFKEEPPVIEGPIVGEPGEEGPIIEVPETDFTTLSIKHAYNLREIQILNPDKLIITSVYLFDLNGNLIENYTNIPQNKEIKLKVGNYSSGVYLLKVYAEGKIISKKIIINN